MGIPKFLESKIKSIFHCCIDPLVAQFQAVINPSSPTFLLRRPNDELFIVIDNKATVGMADYASTSSGPIITGRQYGGADVYESRFEVPLTTTGGAVDLTLPLGYGGVDRLFEIDLVFLENSSGNQYYLNGGIASLCDATILVTNTGVMRLIWTTAHTDDDVYVYVRYIPITIPYTPPTPIL